MPAGGKIGNKGGGRKSKAAELQVVEYYKNLLPKAFIFAEQMFSSENKQDKLWAMDWLKAGLVKMIPQKLAGDDSKGAKPILVKFINGDEFKNN